MSLTGKGFFIWQILNCDYGNPFAIASAARSANLSHVIIKVADRSSDYNLDMQTGQDLVPDVVEALHDLGIEAWGWQYIYGSNPMSEANRAIHRVKELGLDGFVVNAEKEYKEPGKDKAAKVYMQTLRRGIPNTPVALSTYRYPSYHPQFPYDEFLEYSDYNMPQVYWLRSHNPDYQLTKSVREFESRKFVRPIMPTGAAFGEHGWKPSLEEIHKFMKTAVSLGLPGVNFWSWDYARKYEPRYWKEVAKYDWEDQAEPVPVTDIVDRYINALNDGDPIQLSELYTPKGVHINASRTIQGKEQMLGWYYSLLNDLLPQATFEITNRSETETTRNFSWKADSANGKVLNGNDTFGLKDGLIAYHYTFFSIVS